MRNKPPNPNTGIGKELGGRSMSQPKLGQTRLDLGRPRCFQLTNEGRRGTLFRGDGQRLLCPRDGNMEDASLLFAVIAQSMGYHSSGCIVKDEVGPLET